MCAVERSSQKIWSLRPRANLALRGGGSAPTQLRTGWGQPRYGEVNPPGHGWRHVGGEPREGLCPHGRFFSFPSFLPSPMGLSTGNTSFNLGFVKILLKIIKIFKALTELSQRAHSLNGDECKMRHWKVGTLGGKPWVRPGVQLPSRYGLWLKPMLTFVLSLLRHFSYLFINIPSVLWFPAIALPHCVQEDVWCTCQYICFLRTAISSSSRIRSTD